MGKKYKAIAFGEILWDILPEKKCLGGAPFNCGIHLGRLGFETKIISALGDDELGEEALDFMKKEGAICDYVGILDGIPTGFTNVVVQDGIPSYEFNSPCAWDKISISENQLNELSKENYDVCIFGTLAQRSEISRKTLYSLLKNLKIETVFFDVNIRKNYYSKKIIEDSLIYADIVKMNDEEIPIIANQLGYQKSDDEFIYKFIEDFGLKGVIATLGKKGSAAYFDNKKYHCPAGTVKVVDTVGAGDSFSAAFLASFVRNCNVEAALKKGSKLADFVVSQRGAIPALPTLAEAETFLKENY